jgi:hypothetical protein
MDALPPNKAGSLRYGAVDDEYRTTPIVGERLHRVVQARKDLLRARDNGNFEEAGLEFRVMTKGKNFRL